jgi:dipeptidyl aminopeptidase/acylaminoacyl peptidase
MGMNSVRKALATGVIGVLLSAAGCGVFASSHGAIPISSTPQNGTVASYHIIHSPFLPSGVKMYRIYYWSKGVKVEASLTEPAKGRYPLLVTLHGGYPLPHSHDNLGYRSMAVMILASTSVAELYPEYQGYLRSPGPTGGIRTDFINVQDAIAIAGEFGHIKAHDTYLLGYSLGGAVALMTAGWDHQVRAVAAVSPSVGLADQVAFMETHPKIDGPSLYPDKFQLIAAAYGYNTQSRAYRERSPDPQKIETPVLLLQGTADPYVVWQTVRMFAEQMKKAHRTVKLILYPGGNHTLYGRYAAASTQALEHWFKHYGLRISL